jgi:hypothetical protein
VYSANTKTPARLVQTETRELAWERRTGNGGNITFPARQDAVDGEHRSFALLRPITDISARIRDLVLQPYAEFEEAPVAAE